MIDGLVIRKAGLDDAAVVAGLLTELNHIVGAVGYPEPFASMPEYAGVTPEKARSRLQRVEGVETVLLAEVFGEPAGFTSLRLIPYLDQDTPYAEVTQMHVRPQFRRHRIGEALIAGAERLSLIAGATCVHIITGQDNPGAQTFYAAMGYEPLCVEFEKFISVPANSEGQGAHG